MVRYVVHSKVVDQVRETVTLADGTRADVIREVMSMELGPLTGSNSFIKLALQRSDGLAQLQLGDHVEVTFSPVE
jgi:hypothetical protein